MGDLNGDGVVNNADLQALLNLLKSGGGSSDAVPEPAALVLLVIGALAIAFHCRPTIESSQMNTSRKRTSIQIGAGNDNVYLGGSSDWVGAGSLYIDVGKGTNSVQFGDLVNNQRDGGVGIRNASTIIGEGVNYFFNDSLELSLYDTIFEGELDEGLTKND